ncbi:MAG: hypothetical protein ABFC34_17265 [Methanobacterium sp.]
MSYLVCNKCGSYYKLQEGENPEEFDLTCECGCKLQYKKSIKSDNSIWEIDLKALLVGITITYFMTVFSYISHQYYFLSYSVPAVGGFLTSYITSGSGKKRVFNSFIVVIIVSISAFLLFIYLNSYSQFISDFGMLYIINVIMMSLLPFILPFIAIGTFSGYVAVIIKDMSYKPNKKTILKVNNEHPIIYGDNKERFYKESYSKERKKLNPLAKTLIIIVGGILISNILIIPAMLFLFAGLEYAGPSGGSYFIAIFFGICTASILSLLWFLFRKK